MAYQSKPNTGVLFRNDKKRDERDADYKGSFVNADGVECWLDAWVNKSSKGTSYMSIRVGKPKGQRDTPVADKGRATEPPQQPDLSDEIPF